MYFPVRRLVLSYAVAAGGVLLAGLSHWWLAPILQDTPPMRLLLVIAVMAAAWLGGLGPGLFASVLGILAIVAANDSPGDLASLGTRIVRFGSLALLLTGLFTGIHCFRHRAHLREQDLRRSERRYKRLVETAGEGIWALLADGSTSYANPRIGEMLGVPPDELIRRPLSEFLEGGDLSTESWLELTSGASARELRLRARDGTVHNVVVTARPIGDDEILEASAARQDVHSGGTLLMVTDVTDLRRAERTLREKESLLRSFYDSSVMALGVIELMDDDARFISTNALTDQFFGIAPGKLEGRTAGELRAPPEMLSVWIEKFRECRATGLPVRFEYQAPCPSSPQWVSATLTPMRRAGAGRVLCSFIVEDITERKRADAELRDAKDVAEAACRAKDRFLAVLSHELRTPLTPVLFGVSSLLDSNKGEELRPTLEMIRRNIELEARLIDDLLDVSRLSRGRMRLECETIDIHDTIRRAIEICQDETFLAGLEVVTEFAAAQHHVHADDARLMQIFWNVIRNAVKFTKANGRLLIRSSNAPRPGALGDGESELIVVEFEDNGSGIEAAVLPRIFEAFEQHNDDLRGRSGGLGLGLAISRSLAEAFGGRLTASSPGRGLGSTFRFELATVPAPVERRPAAPAPFPPAPRARRSRDPACGSCWSTTTSIPSGTSRPFFAVAGTKS